jgi:hypothetical protein
MFAWARSLEDEGALRLLAYQGTTKRTALLPYLLNDDAGLMTIWNDSGAYISLWRSVFERHVPDLIPSIEMLIAPAKPGRGNTIKHVSDELLDELAEAYRRASAPHSRIT